MFNTNIKSLFDLQKTFPTEQSCIDYLEYLIWNGAPISPFDSTSKVYKCKDNRYKCKNTGKYFNIKTGSCFENTKIPLQKWMMALWLLTNNSTGYTSVQLSKDIDVTQPNAWFLLQRIRKCFLIENEQDLEGEIEIDETFYGGKNINRHKDKKVEKCQGRSFKDKTPVIAMLQRPDKEVITRPSKVNPEKTVNEIVINTPAKITAIVVPDTKKATLQPIVKEFVKPGSRILTDEWLAYKGLNGLYLHNVIDHSKKEYVNLDDATMHTNNVEGSWRLLKRAIKGNYNCVSPKHLQLYVDEWVYRFNLKHDTVSFRFNNLLKNSGVRTKYKDLVA